MELNLDSLNVDSQTGRVSFSGLGTGIDIAGAVDNIIAAKRLPAVNLETKIDTNTTKITALRDLRTSLDTLQTAIDGMRGAISFANNGDSFAAKQAFASTSRADGLTPSAAGNLIGVSVSNSASTGAHELEVRRVATAHKISSQSFSSLSTALSLSGTFTIGGENGSTSISVQSTDTLADIRDQINNANNGTTATNVTASIVSVSSTEHLLVLTNDELGQALNVSDAGGTVLSGLGLSTTNGIQSIANGLASGSKVEGADGFSSFNLANNEGDSAFLVSFDSSTNIMTLTRGDGVIDAITLNSATIASGDTETANFDKFGVSIVLDSSFDKSTDITADADVSSVTGGTGTITDSTIKISDSTGDISGITTNTLTFGALATPAAISITVGSFSGTFDGTSTGTKTIDLTDGTNTLQIQLDVATVFNGSESAASVTLNELQNLVTSTGSFTTELQKGETARLTADALTDASHHESDRVVSQTALLNSFLTTATFPGSFDISGTGNATINYTATDTLSSLATKINAELATTGVTAAVVTDGDGFRLNLDSSSDFTLTDTNGLISDLNVNNDLVLERTTNTVDDIFNGVTLSLFAAEAGTTVKVEIERDLTGIKTDIQGFVDAFNETRRLLNTHTKIDEGTGLRAEDAGELAGLSLITDIKFQLAAFAGTNVQGVDNDFSGLSALGITLVDNNAIADDLDANTLEIDDTTLDSVLLNNIEDVRRMFAFDFTTTDPDVVLLGFSNNTSFSTSGYTLNIGTLGQLNNLSNSVTDTTATLDDANSFAATTSGSFTINGEAVTYDVTTDTVDSLVGKINNAMVAASNGITAAVGINSSGGTVIRLTSTSATITTANVSGDLHGLLNFQADTNQLDSANIGGVAGGTGDGTVTTTGKTITVTDQSGAEGLRLLYNGPGSESGITLDFTIGIAAQLSNVLDSFVDTADGAIQAEIANLEGQNIVADDRIEDIDTRLTILRESLTRQFVAMEAAVTSMNQVLESVRQQFAALTGE
jgi:flagellar capping protein FliD